MIDLTGIAASVIAGVFTILGVIIPIWLQSYMKDKQAASVLATAVQNSLGAIQQAIEAEFKQVNPKLLIPGVSPTTAIGVHYVLQHAGKEVEHFGLTPAAIADKINAKIGLENIKSNIATFGNPTSTSRPVSTIPESPVVFSKIANNSLNPFGKPSNVPPT